MKKEREDERQTKRRLEREREIGENEVRIP